MNDNQKRNKNLGKQVKNFPPYVSSFISPSVAPLHVMYRELLTVKSPVENIYVCLIGSLGL